MRHLRNLRKFILISLVFVALTLTGCSAVDFNESEIKDLSGRILSWELASRRNSTKNLSPGDYAIDPVFKGFYAALGGEAVLGPAISPVATIDGVVKQYLAAGLMIFDPTQVKSTRFSLAPLGLELGVGEGELLGKAYQSGRIINGYLVIGDFLTTYERLGGARFVGKPISEAYYNREKSRIEQYFENLGFYKLDSESKVRLMAYGAYACDRNCRDQGLSSGIAVREPILPQPFLNKIVELGLPFVGKPLTGLHYAPDGKQEVIFENLVLVADANNPENVYIRSIAVKVGDEAYGLSFPSDSQLDFFYEIKDGMGYNIPTYFIDYMDQFGGLQTAGKPISEVFSPEPGVYWQCFTNLCLEFTIKTDSGEKLGPVPLGSKYLNEEFEAVRDFSANQQLDDLDIKVWEKNTFVASDGFQEIHVALYESGSPLKNFEPLLIVTMPDGSQRKAYFQPSDKNGRTSIGIPPIQAPSGTLIAYRICLALGIPDEPRCVGDNYLIWDSD